MELDSSKEEVTEEKLSVLHVRTYVYNHTHLFFLEEFTHFTHVCVSNAVN